MDFNRYGKAKGEVFRIIEGFIRMAIPMFAGYLAAGGYNKMNKMRKKAP